MNEINITEMKKNIIAIGRLLWEKELVSGLNGNISSRIDQQSIVLTATGTCLGLLKEKNILHMKLDGEMLEQGNVSTEKFMHIEIYKQFPEVQAIVHTHTPYANGYFLENDKFVPRIFESKIYLGSVQSVNQLTPSVTEIQPVLDMLKSNNIGVLRQHGILAIGKDLFDCFLLVQALEEAIKVEMVSRVFRYKWPSAIRSEESRSPVNKQDMDSKRTFKMFSQEQMDEIVRLVNQDEEMKSLGEKTQMCMELGVKLNDTGQVFSFEFNNGLITKVGQNEAAEFLVSASKDVWRSVFRREIDPFVATTQKKMNLQGDFARISKWYAPCNRIFELWTHVPID